MLIFFELFPVDGIDYKTKESVIEEELARLQEEGLIEHSMHWEHGTFFGGTVKRLTPAGVEFARLIEDNKVWLLCEQTLKGSGLDVSYPLIKKVCERIVEHIVLGCIPEDYRD